MPPGLTRPPPPGFDSIILPAGISSLNTFSEIADTNPNGASDASASLMLRPATEGTIIFVPGPTSAYQPPDRIARTIKIAIQRFRRTRALVRRRISRVFSLAISRVGFFSLSATMAATVPEVCVIFSLETLGDLRDLSLTGRGGRSSSRLIWVRSGSSSV